MVRITVFLLLTLSQSQQVFAAELVTNSAYLEINKNVIARADYKLTEFGMQSDISEQQIEVDVGFGKVGTIFLQLPPRNQVINIDLTTIVRDEKVYYPVVILLDQQFNWVSIFEKGNLELHQRGMSEAVSTSQIKISPFVKYLVITTRQQLIGDKLQYQKTESKAEMLTGSVNQPEYSLYTIQHTAQFTATPYLELLIPEKLQSQAVRHQTGWLIEFGFALGNESMPLSNSGDDYKVGSGVAYGLGYAISTKQWRKLTYRFSAGQREQGGYGKSSASYAQVLALTEFSRFNLGGGIYADMNNTVTTQNGAKINFDDAYGLQLAAEWRLNSHLNFSSKYLLVAYQDDNGNHYNGNQFMLQMQFFN